MKYFRSNPSLGVNLKFLSKESCGTVGCALGLAPFVPGLETIEYDFCCLGSLGFNDYSERVFGIGCIDDCWIFLFNSDWYKIDNSREGFVKRVLYLIEGGDDLELSTNQYKNINPNKIYEY